MEKRLVKILEDTDEIDVSKLSENNICEYLQAVRTVDRLKDFIVNPFIEFAKKQTTKEESLIYSENEVKINLFESKTLQKHSPKSVVGFLKNNLRMVLENNSHDMRAYGVKRFNGNVAVDARYFSILVNEWQGAITGHTVSHRIAYSGNNVCNIAKRNVGNLFMVNSPVDFLNFDYENIALYLSADIQAKALLKRIVNPFESAFKSQGNKTDHTDLTLNDYGGLSVLVKTVPRFESDYRSVLSVVKEYLDAVANYYPDDVDFMKTYFNHNLCEPRAYVSVDSLTEKICGQEKTLSCKYKQDISILYKPEFATVLTLN